VCGCGAGDFPIGRVFKLNGETATVTGSLKSSCSGDCKESKCAVVNHDDDPIHVHYSFGDPIELIPAPEPETTQAPEPETTTLMVGYPAPSPTSTPSGDGNSDVKTTTTTTATTTTTTTITNTAPYVLGAYSAVGSSGTDSCPIGYHRITDSYECEVAAAFAGKSWKGSYDLGSTYTGGCSHRANHPQYTGVWFNPTLTGSYDGHGMTGQVAPLCKMSPYILGTYSAVGSSGTDSCPTGYGKITDNYECEVAAAYVAKGWKGSYDLGSTYTGGCSHRANHPQYTGVWFNPTLTGSYDGHGMTGEVAPLCKMPWEQMLIDARCGGSSRAECIHLQDEGADCRWQIAVTTSIPPSEPGECAGNDSRCGRSSKETCELLGTQGSDCIWEASVVVDGGCKGNDSRCPDSSHARCLRLSGEGADCWWEAPDPTSSGTCAGNDSRCSGSSEQVCDRLEQEASNCRWRDDYSLTGTIDMDVSGAGGDVSDGVANGLSEMTGVQTSNIDVGTTIVNSRRLKGRKLSQAVVSIRANYVIVVDSDVPSSVVLTGSQMGQLLQASNSDNISAAILSGLQGTYFASEDLNVTVKDVGVVELGTINVATSTSTKVATSTSANVAASIQPQTTATTRPEASLEVIVNTSARGSQAGVSHLLLLLPAIATLLF